MPTIGLSQGKETVVSEEDFEYLNRWKWTFDKYAYRQSNTTLGKRRPMRMHRVIMERVLGGPIPEGYQVDHINRNKLDNRRENLRLATRNQNLKNSKGHGDSTSSYKGVSWDGSRKRWRAQFYVAGKNTHLGNFNSEEEAARAYDAKAKEFHGEFAYLNFPHSPE